MMSHLPLSMDLSYLDIMGVVIGSDMADQYEIVRGEVVAVEGGNEESEGEDLEPEAEVVHPRRRRQVALPVQPEESANVQTTLCAIKMTQARIEAAQTQP
ncbi:hypothetical protein L2E82_18166 [Cichorium intybus]|uniref:Uncharacterized protein n=1 Tax=Cichorium intybus TaxID=13427 RepID=A0ACB9F9P2_CICIN|nr:hypothetical protein L2E82_18166 [Cichorium intybus]